MIFYIEWVTQLVEVLHDRMEWWPTWNYEVPLHTEGNSRKGRLPILMAIFRLVGPFVLM